MRCEKAAKLYSETAFILTSCGVSRRIYTDAKGKVRKRLLVKLATALATAGAMGGRPASPMPPGWLSVGMTLTVIKGVSLARKMR